jgi:hypothetical protein
MKLLDPWKPADMIYASIRCRCFKLIIAVVSLVSAGSSSAFARRAYSYGSSTEGEAVTRTASNTSSSSATTAATSKAITKDDISTVHKTTAPVKKVTAKKHADARVDAGNADEDSILNVFAPAPIDALPAKDSHKTNDKSVVVAGVKK